MFKKLCLFLCAIMLLTFCQPIMLSSAEEDNVITAWVVNIVSHYAVTDNYVADWVRENSGINLKVTHEFTGNDAKAKLAYAMATEPLPDVLLSTGWTKAECAVYGSQGYVIPLDRLLEGCENWKRVSSECRYDRVADLTMPDGHIYCYGTVNECFHLTHQARMWVYGPWIDSLCGGKLPETTEEFREYLRKVAASDPNGNGIKDEIPLTGEIYSGFATDPFTFISNSFVHNNNIYGSTNSIVAPGCYIDNGEVRLTWEQEGYRDALVYMRELFMEGLLYGQTYTQNWDQLANLMKATPNRVGAVSCGMLPSYSNAQLPDGTWTEWRILPPLKGPDGTRMSFASGYDYFGCCNGLITRNCKNPELAIKLFELLASEEGTLVQNYGQKGVSWDWVNEGTGIDGSPASFRTYSTEYMAALDSGNKTWNSDVQISAFTEDVRTGLMVEEGEFNGEKMLWECAELYEQWSPGEDTIYPNIAFTPEQSSRVMQLETALYNYVRLSTVNYITGAYDPVTDWDNYISNLNNLHSEEYRLLLQEAYNTWKK